MGLLLAQLHALDGHADLARQEFDRAVAAAHERADETMQGLLALIGARLFPTAAAMGPVEPTPAVQALAEARTAYNRGDRAAARNALAGAEQRGVLEANYADEARLLAAELDLPIAPERLLDPPYPPLSLAGARLWLRDRAPSATPGIDR
jgi:hypothetical protein